MRGGRASRAEARLVRWFALSTCRTITRIFTDSARPDMPCSGRGMVVHMNGLLRELVLEARDLAARDLAGLIWPVSCAGCGLPDTPVCGTCAAAMAGEPFLVRAVPVPIWGISVYQGIAAQLIVSWKQRGRRDLSGWLGRELARGVGACLREPGGLVWLVPMPARAAALQQRGADLCYDLARAAARACRSGSDPHRPEVRAVRVLRHARGVRDQIGLDARERRRNLAGALTTRAAPAAARRSLIGRNCIVVDDIVTTGASVDEAVRVLTAHGARVVGVCCLSVTFKQHGVLNPRERTSLSSWKAPSESQRPGTLGRRQALPQKGGASAAT